MPRKPKVEKHKVYSKRLGDQASGGSVARKTVGGCRSLSGVMVTP
jgi:hypothetical protein